MSERDNYRRLWGTHPPTSYLRDRDAAEGGDADAAPVPQDQQARGEAIAKITENATDSIS